MLSGCTEQSLRSTCAPILRHTDLGTTHDGPLETSVQEIRGGAAGRRRQGGAGPVRHGSGSPCGLHIRAPLNLLTDSARSLLCRGAYGGRVYAAETVSPPCSGQSQGTAVPCDKTRRRCRGPETSPCARREHGSSRNGGRERVTGQSPAGEPRGLATHAEGKWGHTGFKGPSVLRPDQQKLATFLLPDAPTLGEASS